MTRCDVYIRRTETLLFDVPSGLLRRFSVVFIASRHGTALLYTQRDIVVTSSGMSALGQNGRVVRWPRWTDRQYGVITDR